MRINHTSFSSFLLPQASYAPDNPFQYCHTLSPALEFYTYSPLPEAVLFLLPVPITSVSVPQIYAETLLYVHSFLHAIIHPLLNLLFIGEYDILGKVQRIAPLIHNHLNHIWSKLHHSLSLNGTFQQSTLLPEKYQNMISCSSTI